MRFICNVFFWLWMITGGIQAYAAETDIIRIGTKEVDLIFNVNENGRLCQSYFGRRLMYERDFMYLKPGKEVYITHGMEDYFEPAIRILHNDGNPSLLLKYISHETHQKGDNIIETVVVLKDEVYPVEVKLFFTAFVKENIVKSWTEISHREKNPVVLYQYASSMLHFNRNQYWLTEFCGDWANEANMTECRLNFGKKVIDTKLGARADMFCSPFFVLALDEKAQEDSGEVLVGTLAWTGNFRFTFEMDNRNGLRVISGINPYGSEYSLKPKEVFRTPEFIFTYSTTGKGEASRNFHRWAREYQLKDGKKGRMTLLNNWEATYFDFDEQKLSGLLDEAKKLDVDMFLLDDGWFANKYPRTSDRQGLGDWTETKEKFPNGLGKLIQQANAEDLKFGLWIEPEMINPKSELYEKHRDWVIRFPNRSEYYYRNQLVLDLSNPAVQDYIYQAVDGLMTKYPGIAYFKWDCNSPITNIYSSYLKEKQSHLYIEYVRGLYHVLERVKQKYPMLPMMLCSGGGGRSDYEALKYFTEFWPSDNTDPVERIFIQWGYSHLFPSKSMAAHVTSWGKQSLKFKVDVAFMCKLGFDIRVSEMNEREVLFCRQAVQDYKRLSSIIWDGDLYRLVSPYDGEHAAVMYVDDTAGHAVIYTFDMHPRYAEVVPAVRLKGLDATKNYRVKEINLMSGTRSTLESDGKVYSGDYLMNVGLRLLSSKHLQSHVIVLTIENL